MQHFLLFWKWIILIGPSPKKSKILKMFYSLAPMLTFFTEKFPFKKELHGFSHIYMASKAKSFTFKQFYTNLNEFTLTCP
jgi:hypothetical protein